MSIARLLSMASKARCSNAASGSSAAPTPVSVASSSSIKESVTVGDPSFGASSRVVLDLAQTFRFMPRISTEIRPAMISEKGTDISSNSMLPEISSTPY